MPTNLIGEPLPPTSEPLPPNYSSPPNQIPPVNLMYNHPKPPKGRRSKSVKDSDDELGSCEDKEHERRSANNTRERIRVRDINSAFKELGRMCTQHMPTTNERSLTKLSILHHAVQVIGQLETEVRIYLQSRLGYIVWLLLNIIFLGSIINCLFVGPFTQHEPSLFIDASSRTKSDLTKDIIYSFINKLNFKLFVCIKLYLLSFGLPHKLF